jgi:hypothetical protein
MVEQVTAFQGPHTARGSGARVVRVSSSPATEPAVTAPWLLVFVMICLLTPGNFTVAGAQLSMPRVMLLGFLPFLVWRWLRGDAGKLNVVDILMLFCTLWMTLALIINHGLSAATRGIIMSVEIFGGYLVGRMLIRNTADYRRFFMLLTCGLAVLLPFALVEMLTGKNLIRPLFDTFLTIPPRQSNLGMRLGMVRAQTIFEHPILYGLVGSMGVANMLYIYRDQFFRSLRLSGFFIFIVFTSISSGPMLSVLLQIALTVWDRFLRFLKGRWYILAGLGLFAVLLMRVASEFSVLDFVIQNFMFNPDTAAPRLIILEYGSAEIVRHPIFGIGLNEWVRPWYKKSSVDNFWLNFAMRFGLPSLLFLILALVISTARIAMQKTLSRQEANYRTGYLITLAGLVVTLGTVYIWGATFVFVTIFIGAGAIFYMREEGPAADNLVRARRAAQARAFEAAAPARAPAGPGPVHAPPRRTVSRSREGSSGKRTAYGSRVRGNPGDRHD